MLTKTELYELYVEQHLTDCEIAVKCGYSEKSGKMSIYRMRKRYGIPKLHKWQRHVVDLTERQRQVIVGGLLGDASVSNGRKSGQKKVYDCESCLEFKQGPKQTDYLRWKYKELEDVAASSPQIVGDNQLRFRSFHHPKFSELRKEWYPDGKKRVPASIVNLNVLGLAVWFMDDGQNCSDGLSLAFSTCAFDRQDHDLLLLVLSKNFSIQGQLRVYSGYNMLYINNDCRDQFLQLILPYCPQSMHYKLRRKRLDHVISKRQNLLS